MVHEEKILSVLLILKNNLVQIIEQSKDERGDAQIKFAEEIVELFDKPDITNSISAKAEMINALTNTMKVNKEVLGQYHELRDDSLRKLKKLINSIDI